MPLLFLYLTSYLFHFCAYHRMFLHYIKDMNTGFTYSNPRDREAVVVVGPASSSDEFLNTLVHEIHHLAVAIASELGVRLDGEIPAYLSGDTILELAEVVYLLGCPAQDK